MTRWKKTATGIAALAALGAAGLTMAAPAAAGDNYGTGTPISITAGPAKSWGPFTTDAGLKKGLNNCHDVGTAGVKAKKWRSYTCETSPAKTGRYVDLWVKI
ncbi:hypothetical protein AB0O07_28515 [Streptomyces sp. NPDC093085]|uniref:hypothetical protein n=1 Tax=Streptomyces sp. NPDC093085 TaxID=3155068 RepID=UPI00342112BF